MSNISAVPGLQPNREALEEAAEQSVRAGQIVRRLRDFMSNGEMERRLESLQRLINEANALALVGSRELDIDVQFSLDEHADLVFVDRIQVQQVLVNLIRNAIEAMMCNDMRCLSVRTASQPDKLVRVTVEDTGSGISEAIAPQLFQPFVTSKENGMGIGLSICRTIVEAHGGLIAIGSSERAGHDRPGSNQHGAEIILILPLGEQQGDMNPAPRNETFHTNPKR